MATLRPEIIIAVPCCNFFAKIDRRSIDKKLYKSPRYCVMFTFDSTSFVIRIATNRCKSFRRKASTGYLNTYTRAFSVLIIKIIALFNPVAPSRYRRPTSVPNSISLIDLAFHAGYAPYPSIRDTIFSFRLVPSRSDCSHAMDISAFGCTYVDGRTCGNFQSCQFPAERYGSLSHPSVHAPKSILFL